MSAINLDVSAMVADARTQGTYDSEECIALCGAWTAPDMVAVIQSMLVSALLKSAVYSHGLSSGRPELSVLLYYSTNSVVACLQLCNMSESKRLCPESASGCLFCK